MPRRLFFSEITSIGAVPAGDNPRAQIMLFKRRPTDSDSPSGDGVVRMPVREPGQGRSNGGNVMERPDGIDEDTWAPIEKAFADTETELEAARERVTALETQLTDESGEDEEVEIPEAVQKKLDANAEELAKARAEVAAERETRIRTEVTKTAGDTVAVVGDDPVEHLYKIRTTIDSEQWDWLTDRFEAVQKMFEQSEALKELGVKDGGDPATQIENLAVEKRKDNPKLSPQQARQLVREERPDLKQAEREAS